MIADGRGRKLPSRDSRNTCEGKAGLMRFNVNDHVKVRLTERGRTLLRKNHDKLFAPVPPAARMEFFLPEEDAEGWSEWQLWCLMQEFGPHMHMGFDPPFETTIELPCETI